MSRCLRGRVIWAVDTVPAGVRSAHRMSRVIGTLTGHSGGQFGKFVEPRFVPIGLGSLG